MPSNIDRRTDSRWVARMERDGRLIYLGTRPTEEEARALWEREARRYDEARPSTIMAKIRTVGDFYAAWLVLCPRPDAETNRHNASMLKSFVARFRDRLLTELTPLEVQQWAIDHRSHVRYAKVFYRDAVKLGLCATNPVVEMALIVEPGRGRADQDPPTREQMLAAMSAAARLFGPSFGALVGMACTTGMRQVELVDLQRAQVRLLPTLEIELPAIKRGHRRIVTFPHEARAEQAAFLAELPDLGHVFHRDGEPWTTAGVRKAWARVRSEVGPDCSFHALRHGCASWLRECGYRRDDVAMLLWGHRGAIDLLDRLYDHPDRRAALERLRRPA